MKLRILDNSIRLRLSQSEVEAFRKTGRCEAITPFPGGKRLVYALQVSDAHGPKLSTEFNGEYLTVFVPTALGISWTESDLVSLKSDVQLLSGPAQEVLVEKDFKCLHREGVDESDNYPHPKEVHKP